MKLFAELVKSVQEFLLLILLTNSPILFIQLLDIRFEELRNDKVECLDTIFVNFSAQNVVIGLNSLVDLDSWSGLHKEDCFAHELGMSNWTQLAKPLNRRYGAPGCVAVDGGRRLWVTGGQKEDGKCSTTLFCKNSSL